MEAFGQFIPLILIFAIMYFLLIRPQQKKMKEHQKMVEGLRRGDVVITQGGLIGKVVKVKENNELDVEISDGVKVRVVHLPHEIYTLRRMGLPLEQLQNPIEAILSRYPAATSLRCAMKSTRSARRTIGATGRW